MNIFKGKNSILLIGFVAFLLSSSACQRKTGCESAEKIEKSNLDRQGNLTTKRGSSNLFSKKMRKNMKKRN